MVLDALAALSEHTREPFDVVIVDNPADGRAATGDLLRAETAGVRLVTPAQNLGFGGGNDLGVALTTGELVCFLNPDVTVADGWLQPLVAALDDPAVAIAGPVLINPDGTIQEAGRVVYPDGWTGAIAGRDIWTGDTSQVFARDVDYVSAACWLVRRGEHLARGGFDARYHPAFFEDVDYAFRVESDGQRSRLVVDVPVVHHHGLGGAGKDADPHASYDAFCSVWNARLAEQPARPDSDVGARRARDRLAEDRVGWVDRSGSTRAARRGLADAIGHAEAHPRDRVTFITGAPAGLDIERARRAGVEVAVGDVDAIVAERADGFTTSHHVRSPGAAFGRREARWWGVMVGVVALGGFVMRAVVLRSPLSEFNADEAYAGIQSFEILAGELPVVVGGTVYTLPFESYVYAPFVAVFGAQILPLKLVSTVFWCVSVVSVALIGARLRRRRVGLIAATLVWIAPIAMSTISVTAYLAYSSGMAVTLIAFLLARRIIDDDRASAPLLFLFGLVAGFGFWLHPMFLATLLPMVAMVLWARRRPAAWAWFVAGGIVGCGPLLLWNVLNGFPTLEPPVDLEGTYADRLRTFAFDLLPRAFGLRDADLRWELNAVVGPVLYLGLLGLIGFGLVTLVRQGSAPSRFLLPIVIVSAFPIMAIFENLIYAADGRYGVITFPYLVVAAAVGVDRLLGHTTQRAVLVAGGVGAVWLIGFVAPGFEPIVERGDNPPNAPVADVVDRLDEVGIDRIAGSYWGVLPVEFAADRRVYAAVTPGWPIRLPARQRVVEASPPETVAFVFRLDNETPQQLWLPAASYHREVIGGFVVYLPKSAVTGAE